MFPSRGDEGDVTWVGDDSGEDLGRKREGEVGPPVFDRLVDRERRGAAARGVRGGQGQEPGKMGCRAGGEQVDRPGAPDRIEFVEGGASQFPVGSRRVFGELREEGGFPTGRDSLFVACRRGRLADIEEHGTRLVGVLLDRDAYPIGSPRARGEDEGRRREGVVGERKLLLLC